jgi:peptidoglycan/LPS O-acetylase OafA/YrhL
VCRAAKRKTLFILAIATTKSLAAWGQAYHPAYAESFLMTVLWTGQIMPFFITGILLSKHSTQIHRLWQRLPQTAHVGLIVVAIIGLGLNHEYLLIRTNIACGLEAALIVILAIEAPRLSGFLSAPFPQWLGRISYRVYLVHMPVMLVLVPILIAWASPVELSACIVLLVFIAGEVMYRLIEAPAIGLGRWLTRTKASTYGSGLQYLE